MLALFISLVALLSGPLLSHWLENQRLVASFLDGFIRIVVAGIVLLHILPEGVAETGGWAPLLMLGGALAVFGVEALPDRPGLRRPAIFGFAALGLACHSFLDGVVLGDPGDHDHSNEIISFAIVLHTLPVGLLVWQALKPTLGSALTWGVLLCGAAATSLGFVGGQTWIPSEAHTAMILLQCAVGGTLVHVLAHARIDRTAPDRAASGIGALLGAFAVLALLDKHPIPAPYPDQLSAEEALLSLAYTLAPALLLGYLARGAWFALLPPSNPSGPFAWLSLALRQPEASCAAGPWHRRVLETRPTRTVLGFLASSPHLSAPPLFTSVALLGLPFTFVRLAAAVGISTLLGTERTPPTAHKPPHPQNPWRFALIDGVDHTAPWVLAGLLLGASLEPLLSPNALSGVPPWLAVALSIPAYVCSIGMVPVLWVLLHKGMTLGAAVALSVLAPATNLSTLKQLGERHGWRSSVLYVGLVGMAAMALAYLPLPLVPPVFGRREADFLSSFSVMALAILFVASLLRQGAGGFIAQILHPYGQQDEHDHEEHEDHGAHAHS